MIPKRAIFYWSGGQPSKLRRLSWESFEILNPSWEIVMLGGQPETSYRKTVLASDLARYKALHEHGGYYFDTDIVFRKPIPDSWLECDNACVLSNDGTANGIGVLGGKQGSLLWQYAYENAMTRTRSRVMMECQSLGIRLMLGFGDLRHVAADFGESMFNIPKDALFPYPWNAIEHLWSPVYRKPTSECLGVHWFGGDRLSEEMSAGELPECFVRHVVEEVENLANLPQP